MDDLLGAMFDIDEVVQEIMDWIAANGGYEKNALYVTSDHDHYLTVSSSRQFRVYHVYTLQSHSGQSSILIYTIIALTSLSRGCC